MPLPILPRNINDPTAQDARERKAMASFKKRIEIIGAGVLKILARQRYQVITLNAIGAQTKRYEFLLDENAVELDGREIDDLVDRMILQGGDARRLWLSSDFVEPAYQQGTAMAYSNLALQSKTYKATIPELKDLLSSPGYRKRLGFIKAREFEEMKRFSSQMKANFRVILMDGMAQGINPLDIAQRIKDQTGASIKDANRIARTEITTALRRARLDESEDAMQRLGLPVMMMQISALSSTTRLSHAVRHAKLFTIQQVRDWMATSPNMINCKCTFVEVMVDDDGTPWTPDIIEKAEAMRPADREYSKG